MDDPLFIEIRHRLEDFVNDLHSVPLAHRYLPLAVVIKQVSIFKILSYDVYVGTRIEHLLQPDNIGMV